MFCLSWNTETPSPFSLRDGLGSQAHERHTKDNLKYSNIRVPLPFLLLSLRRLLAALPLHLTYINPLRNLDTRFRGFGAIAAPALAALRGGA